MIVAVEDLPDRPSRPGAVQATLAFIELLIFSVWLGSMIFFSFAVAPAAFKVLPSQHLAGLLVGATLSRIEYLGLVAGPVLCLFVLAGWSQTGESTLSKSLRLAFLLIMTAMAGISKFAVTATMTALRDSAGSPIDLLPSTDPARIQFDHLHHYSVILMSVCLLSGLLYLFLRVRSLMTR